jgi:hypothetical protein
VRRTQNLILLPWLSLPAIALGFLALWHSMPAQIAVHFTSAGDPVTALSRQGFLLFSLATLLLVLTICTWRLVKTEARNSSRLLLRYYFTVIALVLIDTGILIYNVYLNGSR